MQTVPLMKFSISNLLIVLTLSALWIALILPDHDSKIKNQAVKLQQDLEFIRRGKMLESPITKAELMAAVERTRNKRQAIAKR